MDIAHAVRSFALTTRQCAVGAVCLLVFAACEGGGGEFVFPPLVPPVDLPGILGGHRAIAPGDTVHLQWSSSNPVAWVSDLPAIATVASTGTSTAVVTGQGAGRAVITARLLPPFSFGDFTFIYVYTAPCSGTSTHGTLSVSDTVSGELLPTDCGLVHDWTAGFQHGPSIGWRLIVDSAQTIRINLDHIWSCSFVMVSDTMMAVEAETNALCQNDNQVLTHAFEPGTYVIWAGSSADALFGSYTLITTQIAP